MKILIAPCIRKLRNGERNPREYPHWNEVIKLSNNDDTIMTLTGEKSIDELEKFLKSFDVVVTIDSFIQHFCWYLGVKCIVLWGVSDPLIFGHGENINLLKSRKNLRPNQFDIWEPQKYDPNVFVSPEEVIRFINK